MNEDPKTSVVLVGGIVYHFGCAQGSGNVGWLLSISWLHSSVLQVQLAQAWSSRVKSPDVKAWQAMASLCHPNITENIKNKGMKTPTENEGGGLVAKILDLLWKSNQYHR